jgi:hypothetical protein
MRIKHQHGETPIRFHVDRACLHMAFSSPWDSVVAREMGRARVHVLCKQHCFVQFDFLKAYLRVGHKNLSLFPPCYIVIAVLDALIVWDGNEFG